MGSHHVNKVGTVSSICLSRDYINDPLSLFNCLNNTPSLLLESAEIDSKENIKSIILASAALRFECSGNTVTIQALTHNGKQVLSHLTRKLSAFVTSKSDTSLVVAYPAPPAQLDEYSKLLAVNPFDALRQCLLQISNTSNNPFAIFLGGVFGYDMVTNCEPLPSLPTLDNHCPDYVFYLAETLVVVDHQAKTTHIIGNVFSSEFSGEVNGEVNGKNAQLNQQNVSQQLEHLDRLCNELPRFSPCNPPKTAQQTQVNVSPNDSQFKQQVRDLKHYISEGDIFQVVPSRTFSLPCPEPLSAYYYLKAQNPSPYLFFMRDADFCLFGASPESALKYCPTTNQVEVYPIAGTRKRGKNPDGTINLDLDSRIELELRNDEKERAEHLMLVDLARNDVARISTAGSRHVKNLLQVDRYSQVMHLVSQVAGTLKPKLDALHAYQACMNMGTLVGAPKIRAAQLISQVEQKRRGSYGGAVGYLTADGAMDSCIVIRSAFVSKGTAYVQAGAGVVYDSCPQSECDETRAKAQAVLNAISSSLGAQNNAV